MKLGMYEYIVTPEPISTAYFINPSHQSVSIRVSPIVTRQRLGKKVTAAIIVGCVVFYGVLAVSREVGD
jgi:hypothetical protein